MYNPSHMLDVIEIKSSPMVAINTVSDSEDRPGRDEVDHRRLGGYR
jgi:hypothetical protein